MELQVIEKDLIEQIERDSKSKVVHTDCWCIPVHTYHATYQPYKKTTMDILMKIILFSLQQSNFESADELSEILLVEPLFIEDLLKKMQRNGLVKRETDVYVLTEKGIGQLGEGIFEEQLEIRSIELLYSPVHNGFLDGDIEEVLDFEDFPEKMYRHYEQKDELPIPEEQMLHQIRSIQSIEDEDSEEEQKIEIKSIESIEEVQINDIPIIEFVIRKNNELNIKTWNTLMDTWDPQLEYELNQENHIKEMENLLNS